MKQLSFPFMNEHNTVGLKEYTDAELLEELVNRKVIADILNSKSSAGRVLEILKEDEHHG